ncbi:MAG: M23 family metallopeptidase [Candidatus Eisenbacteria bacterium]|nr:M23 family metallopeptidase [Candidatus Eisenbacteria bacterium]
MLIAALAAAAPRASLADSPRLAGLIELTPRIESGWPWAGAWLFPVGDRYDFARPDSASAGYGLLRGVSAAGEKSAGHQGADLGNGAGGGSVRAAASGVVVRGADDDWQQGYGWYVTVAHRMTDGGLAYSVYAHLAPGSVALHAGDFVLAGQPIGRVGRSGRATACHLHFEVRLPRDPGERWEKTRVVDPLQFVRTRLPAHRDDPSWARPYLEWAELEGLIAASLPAERALSRALWWNMLARLPCVPASTSAGRGDDARSRSDSLRARLIEIGVLDEHASHRERGTVCWDEFASDLGRLIALPMPSPRGRSGLSQEEDCALHLGGFAEYGRLPRGTGHKEPVTLAHACLALADACGGVKPPAAPDFSSRHPTHSHR